MAHFLDPVGTLAELQEEGKILHIGLSNVSVEQLNAALEVAPIISVQNRMNVFDRSSTDVLHRCEKMGITFLSYSPLSGMGQAGRIGENRVLSRIANNHGVSPQQVALAWLLQRSPVILPIPGASKSRNIVDFAHSVKVTLTSHEMAELNAITD